MPTPIPFTPPPAEARGFARPDGCAGGCAGTCAQAQRRTCPAAALLARFAEPDDAAGAGERDELGAGGDQRGMT